MRCPPQHGVHCPFVTRQPALYLTVMHGQLQQFRRRRLMADPQSTRLFRCPSCDALYQVLSRGGFVRFKRPIASLAVITKLVELGYLRPGARHRTGAIEQAIGRLRKDLIRDGVILPP
jgi:hypothetical protein